MKEQFQYLLDRWEHVASAISADQMRIEITTTRHRRKFKSEFVATHKTTVKIGDRIRLETLDSENNTYSITSNENIFSRFVVNLVVD